MCNMIQHQFPCLDCHPHSYIRMVQCLIEKCLILHMNEDQCVNALAKHAHIQPLVTTTVWKELLKENEDFFKAYYEAIDPPAPGPLITSISNMSTFKQHQVLEEEEEEEEDIRDD